MSATVILAYAHYPQYLGSLAKVVARLATRLRVTRVLVVTTLDTAKVAGVFTECKFSADIKVLAHDNQGWEFGGYQRGLDALRESWQTRDTLVILNDTVGRHSVLTGGMVKSFVVGIQQAANTASPVLVGEFDTASSNHILCGRKASLWARSCLLAINTAGLECLAWRVHCQEFVGAVLPGGEGRLTFTDQVSPGLAGSISRWLLGDQPDSRWCRPDASDTSVNDGLICQKGLSILNERHLSARLLASGSETFNISPTRLLGVAAYRLNRKWNTLRRKYLVARPAWCRSWFASGRSSY